MEDNRMPKLEKETRAKLEEAYNAIFMAGENMEIIDYSQVDKIRNVRLSILGFLQGELGI